MTVVDCRTMFDRQLSAQCRCDAGPSALVRNLLLLTVTMGAQPGNGPQTAGTGRARSVPVSGTALLLIDVINDLAFEGSEALVAQAEPMAIEEQDQS